MIYYLLEVFVVEIGGLWLGFGLAFLNYGQLGKVFGIKTPDKTLIKARSIVRGAPEIIVKAFTDTYIEQDEFPSTQ